MKNIAILLLAFIGLGIGFAITAGFDWTAPRPGWQATRAIVTEADDPALAAATMDGRPSYFQSIKNSSIRGIELMGAMTGTTGSYTDYVWVGKGTGGPARLVCTIVWSPGTMVVNSDPQTHETTTLTRYASSATVTSYWPTPVTVSDSGNNRLCTVSFNSLDYDWIAVEKTNLTTVTKAQTFFTYCQ